MTINDLISIIDLYERALKLEPKTKDEEANRNHALSVLRKDIFEVFGGIGKKREVVAEHE